jgi:hypothetical protein
VDPEPLTVICAWCNCTVRSGGSSVSHGICVACAMRFLDLLPRHYLESIADRDGRVAVFNGVQLPVGAAD